MLARAADPEIFATTSVPGGASLTQDRNLLVTNIVTAVWETVSYRAEADHRDYWQAPEETERLGTGDCEDFVILQIYQLLLAGISSDDLRVLLAQDTERGNAHTLLAVRDGGKVIVADLDRVMSTDDPRWKSYRLVGVIDTHGRRRPQSLTISQIFGNRTPP